MTIFIRILILIGLLVGCNSKVNEGLEVPTEVSTKACVGSACAVCELPWGGTLASGQKIESAFSKNIVTCDQECAEAQVTLACEDGVLKATNPLSGIALDELDKVYPKCYKQRCDCDHNGTVVADGEIKKFYKSTTASCANQCASRDLRCRSGKMEDVLEPNKVSWTQVYKNMSCTHVPCSACVTPWGDTVAHGATTKAYSQSEVACGSTCVSKTLTCDNGALTGADLASFRFGTCSVIPCANCELPSGDIIVHGTSPYTYTAAQSTCTQTCSAFRKRATCNNGVVTGVDINVHKFSGCVQKSCSTCKLPCGSTLSSGGKRSCYKNAAPSFCGESCLNESMEFMCDDGVVKKSDGETISEAEQALYKTSYCNDIAACSSCKLPDGTAVVDGTRKSFFRVRSVPCGQQCMSTTNSIALTCSNGVFSNAALFPDFKETVCEESCNTGTDGDEGIGNWEGEGGGAPRQMCTLPWKGGLVTHKTQIVAFSRLSAPVGEKCSDYKKLIECNGLRGTWSGGAAYIYPTCVEEK